MERAAIKNYFLKLVDISSLSRALSRVYHQHNRNPNLAQQTFKDALARRISSSKNFSELSIHVRGVQDQLRIEPRYSGTYLLLYCIDELAETLHYDTPQKLLTAVELMYFRDGPYSPFFVHIRNDVLGSGSLADLGRYLDKTSADTLDMIVVVLATCQVDAIASAQTICSQPLNALKFYSNSDRPPLDELFYTPLVGNALSRSGNIFQSANPMALVKNFADTDAGILSLIDVEERFILAAGALYTDSTQLVTVCGKHHRIPEFFCFVDLMRSSIVDYTEILKRSKKAPGSTPVGRAVHWIIQQSDRYKVVHNGFDNIFMEIKNEAPGLVLSLHGIDSSASGISQSVIDEIISYGYGVFSGNSN